MGSVKKLDGVGPVDNRPSTDKLHHFVKKKKYMTYLTCDTWHMTRESDTCHVTRDTIGGVNILSKFQLPSSSGLLFMILLRSGGKRWPSESVSQWMTRLVIEQPRLHRVC